MMGRHAFLCFFLSLMCQVICAQAGTSVISGYVRDAQSGEAVIGATVYTADKSAGTGTNGFGFYSLRVPRSASTEVICSCVGYVDSSVRIDCSKGNVTHDFELSADNQMLEGATVFSHSKKDALVLPQMGLQTVDVALVRKLPALMGETDIIRVIQMMPGVQAPSEGSTGFSVRGGGVDQNLVLMDEAPVYNAGHFMGFFSVFNNDAVKTADLYKGDVSAKYGGRLSSLLDVHTIDGNMQEFGGSLSVGLISSKVLLEGPIVKDKASFMVAARRTYIDCFFPLFRKLKGDRLYFYDINAKANWIINDNNRLYLSIFSGEDVFAMKNSKVVDIDTDISFANNTQSLRLNHRHRSFARQQPQDPRPVLLLDGHSPHPRRGAPRLQAHLRPFGRVSR